MKQKRKLVRKLLSVLLTLALVLGLMPGMGLTAYADEDGTLLTTITGIGSNTSTATSANVSYSTEGVATLTFSGAVSYQASPAWGWWGYGWSATVKAAEGYNITKCIFYDDANRTATDSEAPFVVETTDEDKTPRINGIPIDGGNSQSKGIKKIEVYGYATPAHTHSFTYSASSATISATCTADGCDLPPSTEGGTDHVAKLSLVAPTLTTYGGTGDATATLDGVAAFNTATGKTIATTDIKYVGRGSTTYAESSTAPTNAGTYTAKITVEEKTASLNYEIAKADPTANAPTGLTATYGQTLSDVTLTNPTGNTDGTWAWVAAGTTSVGNAGDNTFKANFTPTDANYKTVENVDVTITVGKAANPATVTGTATVIKGGNTVDLSGNVTMNGATGDVGYAFGGEAEGCTLSGSVLTSGNSTGTVTVNVTVAADSNYEALAATPITVTINDKQTQTITAENVTANYGDTGKKIEASTTGDGGLSYAVKSGDVVTVDASGNLTIVKAGSAVITVTAAETDTYAQATKDVNVTVNTKAMTVSAEDVNVTVDGQAHGITVTVTDPASGATVKYGTEAGSYTLDASPTQTEVGEKTVYYQVTADNYTTYTGSAKVTVSAKQTQTITAENVTAAYGDTGKSIEASTSGDGTLSYAVKSGDAVTVNETTGALTIVKAGSAVITVTASETATYTQATKDVTVTINKANAVAATVTGNTLIYDSTAEPQPLVTVTGTAVGGIMKYAIGNANEANHEYSESIPTTADIGAPATYYIWYKAFGDANHSDSEAAYVTVQVQEKQYTVTYKVVGGTWSDGSTADKTENVADGATPTGVPTGMIASSGYTGGAWDTNPADATITEATTFTYTFTAVGTISKTVTFKVANGSWNDESVAEKTVTLTGAEGSTLKLSADQIPAVGNKPSEGYKEGSWDTTPSADTEITANTTYTYTYAAKESTPDPDPTPDPEPEPEPTPDDGDSSIGSGGDTPVEIPKENQLSRDEIEDIIKQTGESVAPTDNIKLVVEANSKSASEVPSDEAEELNNNKEIKNGDVKIGAFVEIELAYLINNVRKGTISNPNKAVTFYVSVPASMVADGRTYFVYRIHKSGGTVTVTLVGSSSTPNVPVSSDEFSTYAIGYSTTVSAGSSAPAHTHVYEWTVIKEATESDDGCMAYACKTCGATLYQVPISAYYVFNKSAMEQIEKAHQGATVSIVTDRWISFHKMVLEALNKRPDVTLKVSFLDGEYRGDMRGFTIPAGTNALSYAADTNFAGFMYIASQVGYDY